MLHVVPEVFKLESHNLPRMFAMINCAPWVLFAGRPSMTSVRALEVVKMLAFAHTYHLLTKTRGRGTCVLWTHL